MRPGEPTEDFVKVWSTKKGGGAKASKTVTDTLFIVHHNVDNLVPLQRASEVRVNLQKVVNVFLFESKKQFVEPLEGLEEKV
jgi:hypothetical protein